MFPCLACSLEIKPDEKGDLKIHRDCDYGGEWRLEICPQLFVTEDILNVIESAGLYRKGLPPVAGGQLDQDAVFVDACKLIWAQEDMYKASLPPATLWMM